MSVSISSSVGLGARNKPTDVALVQQLLNRANNSQLLIDGLAGNATIKAIKAFQKANFKAFIPDGLINPHARTFKLLKTFYKPTNSLSNNSTLAIKTDRFTTLYQKQFSTLNS
ncbi:MAG: peptidoglycan-binding protein [Gammaproteobacteria bacterium]|nr:peptidoglycan-binding protein [Gammaproteobacteria bacterium]